MKWYIFSKLWSSFVSKILSMHYNATPWLLRDICSIFSPSLSLWRRISPCNICIGTFPMQVVFFCCTCPSLKNKCCQSNLCGVWEISKPLSMHVLWFSTQSLWEYQWGFKLCTTHRFEIICHSKPLFVFVTVSPFPSLYVLPLQNI